MRSPAPGADRTKHPAAIGLFARKHKKRRAIARSAPSRLSLTERTWRSFE